VRGKVGTSPSVDASSGLTNGITSAYAQNVTVGDGYTLNALALQIDVGSPVLTTTQSVDKPALSLATL